MSPSREIRRCSLFVVAVAAVLVLAFVWMLLAKERSAPLAPSPEAGVPTLPPRPPNWAEADPQTAVLPLTDSDWNDLRFEQHKRVIAKMMNDTRAVAHFNVTRAKNERTRAFELFQPTYTCDPNRLRR